MKRLSLLEGEINSLTTLKKLTNQKLNRDAQNERSPQGRKIQVRHLNTTEYSFTKNVKKCSPYYGRPRHDKERQRTIIAKWTTTCRRTFEVFNYHFET